MNPKHAQTLQSHQDMPDACYPVHRSWASRWTGAVRATWWACKKIAKGVLLAGALSAAAACILVEYSLTCADGDDMHHS